MFLKNKIAKSLFGQVKEENRKDEGHNNLFSSIFTKKVEESSNTQNLFGRSVFLSGKDNSLFSKPENTTKLEKGGSIFSKPVPAQFGELPKSSTNIFGTISNQRESQINKPGTAISSSQNSIFAPNSDDKKLSPGSLFKSACNQENGSDKPNFLIFQSKNKAQTVADSILNSVKSVKSEVYEFEQNDDELARQAELQRLNDEKIKEEERIFKEKRKREEEKKQQELRILEDIKRKDEERRKQEEIKQQEEKRKAEEKQKQEELRKKLEEEKKAEIKRKVEEDIRQFKLAVDKKSTELVEELINELNLETVSTIIKEETENLRDLMNFAETFSDDILNDLCNEICNLEMKAEKFRSEKVMRKWFQVWKNHYLRNCKRRSVLENTPVWLPSKTPVEKAIHLRRLVENTALENMNAFHKGYIFRGELKQYPSPKPYNLMEIIKSPLLKRLKQINYPYGKCFFWKVTLVSPGETQWLQKKINVKKWLLEAFSDKKSHDVSESLIQVSKQSWNHLMDFAISVSIASMDKFDCNEAIEGSNGLLFYFTEKQMELVECIKEVLKYKYPYQVIPIAIFMPKGHNYNNDMLESFLLKCVESNQIKAYRIFTIDSQNISESMNSITKTALKWMAKNYPQNPPIQIDYLKSICQRYLGNDIWCRFKSEKDPRIKTVLKDLKLLIQCYNVAVEKLTEVITDEDLFNYPSFPLEFSKFLDNASPYPKPYEFVPSRVKNSENISAIKDAMSHLKLPNPVFQFNSLDIVNIQRQIRTYSNQIGWFEDPEQVVCKVIAKMPNEFTDLSSSDDFSEGFGNFNIIDFLNILVYEKINNLEGFYKRFAVYKKSALDDYQNGHWLFEINILTGIKYKALEYDNDDIDFFIETKRRKIENNSAEVLMLEEKDTTKVAESIKMVDLSIAKYNKCADAMKELEIQLDEGKKKALELENLLEAALSGV